MKKTKIILVWVLALVITLAAAVFQRMTGPTHPYKQAFSLKTDTYKVKLPRSMEINPSSVSKIVIPVNNENVFAFVNYRVYPSNNEYTLEVLKHTEEGMEFLLPVQPPAGKLEYRLTMREGSITKQSPFLVIRYKDPVPASLLIPHIIIMFFAMFFAIVAGVMATFNIGRYKLILFLAGSFLFVGGMVFGPLVQKFAFGEFWTGIPFGWDLTDNKTLLAVLVFAFAIIRNEKSPSRLWTIIASIFMILIYTIPHSTYGSQLDPETGEVIQASLKAIIVNTIC